jgi:glutathione peroxidase-family protein
MADRLTTTDLYESTFYLLGGCELTGIEAERVNGTISCRLTFQGEKLAALQSEYFAGNAKVLIFPFRRAFGQVNALVYSAKKKAKNQLRQEQAAEGGEP